MAENRIWKLKMNEGVKRGEGPYVLRGFEEGPDADQLIAKKILGGLEFDDLRAIKAQIDDLLHREDWTRPIIHSQFPHNGCKLQ